jgi:hypothetical protein
MIDSEELDQEEEMTDLVRVLEEEMTDMEEQVAEVETIDTVVLEEEEEAALIVRTHGILLLPEDMAAEVEETEVQEDTIPTIIILDNSMVNQLIFSNSNK